jgi:predicted RNA-binding Zn-ribbon protein involved in translation (DUF1610 family)
MPPDGRRRGPPPPKIVIMNTSGEISVNQKQGSVNKCPHCGDSLAAFSSVCKSCGHELVNIDVNRSLNALVQRFEAIELDIEAKGLVEKSRQNAIREKKAQVIRDFPIPNSREDLQQLLYYIQPKLLYSVKPDPNIEDWRAKFTEVLNRAKKAYRDDARTLQEFEKLEQSLQTTVAQNLQIRIRRSPLVALLLVAGVVGGATVAMRAQRQESARRNCEEAYVQGALAEKSRLEAALSQVDAEYKSARFSEALMHSSRLRWEYVSACQTKEGTQEQTLWDAKRTEVVALIQNGIAEQSAKQKLADDRLATEKKAQEDQAAADRRQAEDKAAARRRAEADLAHTREAQAATDARKANVESQY